jgi:hypothetical protein
MTSTIVCSSTLGSADPFAPVGAGKFGPMFSSQVQLGR